MTQVEESYENIRKLLSAGNSRPLPKHELTDKLIRNLYHEEEASIISSSFKEIREYLTVDQILEMVKGTDFKFYSFFQGLEEMIEA